MNRHKDFNRAIGPLRYAARGAADALAVAIPTAPPPPAVPPLPISAREVRWMRAILDLADAADLPDTHKQREALREALVRIAPLLGALRTHPLIRNALRALYDAVPAIKDDARPVTDCLNDAVAAGQLTASQAEHWRYRLGL